VPAMVARNHGMVVTVASLAAYITAPSMVDYAASKAAAMAFHEGLAAELKCKYGASKVRTVVVNQGYTKTALFEGFKNGNQFILPPLEVDTVAEAIVKQVLTGKSGQIIAPRFAGTVSSFLRGMPGWYQNRVRNQGQALMKNWKGRQVIDVETHYGEKKETSESE